MQKTCERHETSLSLVLPGPLGLGVPVTSHDAWAAAGGGIGATVIAAQPANTKHAAASADGRGPWTCLAEPIIGPSAAEARTHRGTRQDEVAKRVAGREAIPYAWARGGRRLSRGRRRSYR